MIINNGPIGSGKFNPEKDLLISYDGTDNFSTLSSTINNIYDFYNESKGWVLFIYSNCDLKFKKKIKNIEMGGIGGGAGGNALQGGSHNAYGGGGGGSSGQRITNSNITLNKGIYEVQIGEGGAGGERTSNPPEYGIGSSGNSTQFINKENLSQIIFEALGGEAGDKQHGGKYNNGNGENGYSYGGRGAKADNLYSGQNGEALFNDSYLNNRQDIKTMGAGGGGGQHLSYLNDQGNYVETGIYTPGGDPGTADLKYGNGGNGGAKDSTSNLGTDGQSGILIIRYKY